MTKNECVWNGKAKSAGDIEWDYLEWCSLKRASSILQIWVKKECHHFKDKSEFWSESILHLKSPP